MKRIAWGRKAQDALPQETAEQILMNVFADANREPNSVPLEALVSYSNYRKERYALQRSVIALILFLFLLLPLLFMAAGVEIQPVSGADENPVYGVSVKTKVPIRQIRATMGGRSVPVYEEGSGRYTVAPRENGEMEITVTLVNRQRTQAVEQVGAVDMDAPILTATEFSGEYVLLFVSDAGSGVDYAGIRVEGQSGEMAAPDGYDEGSACVMIAYPSEILDIRIPDCRGNVLRIQLKPQA